MFAGKLTFLGIPVIAAALLAPVNALAFEESEFRLLSLALHQDTGRSIYLGGIHFPQGIPRPEDLVGAAGPKLMEYRIVTRRTSMRSLLGGMMLQSEVATGANPSLDTTRFANDIIEAVRGSLYAGDSFRILLTEDDHTIALLNGEELARIESGYVADYFLEGWLGEKGPTTLFRDHISGENADEGLLNLYSEHQISEERLAAVKGWSAERSNADMVAVSAVPEPAIEPREAAPEKPEPLAVPQPAAAGVALASAAGTAGTLGAGGAQGAIVKQPELPQISAAETSLPALTEPDLMDVVTPEAEPAPVTASAEPLQLASVAPLTGLDAGVETPEMGAADMIQYSQRLADFNTELLRMVYGSVRYPKVAVRRGLQGNLELDLVLTDSGALEEVIVVRSSGYKILDDAARKAAHRAFKGETLAGIDTIVSEEYGSGDDKLVIPLPIKFMLTE